MSYEEIDESTLTPEELAGKRELDAVQRRYLPHMKAAENDGDPVDRRYDYQAIVHDRDRAEDDLLHRSADARAYLRRVIGDISPEDAVVAAITAPTCDYVTVGYIGNPAQLCGNSAMHYHAYNSTRLNGEEVRLAGAFWLCDEHDARQPKDWETKKGLWEEI
jgi:hypothetical protein